MRESADIATGWRWVCDVPRDNVRLHPLPSLKDCRGEEEEESQMGERCPVSLGCQSRTKWRALLNSPGRSSRLARTKAQAVLCVARNLIGTRFLVLMSVRYGRMDTMTAVIVLCFFIARPFAAVFGESVVYEDWWRLRHQ